uniref:Uncharacterized protein n=1 Tax=Chromera velia CCMP2878 TaxID=1169474 RepID=A0A0G4I7J2_9ALVE|eukprot:Cvel_11669.t1-p1 / transcript=Cvel_11669.t1 / gene=Cvel_11669 / organism=Chromera_velia_CCMP2878 / gene_product=hypothetical protein / transcript_product=hypothetical protein / location=Cvel_scaffold740:1277-2209(-) / protein_length=244 / sequence_SO=supercontig / SO=protein_coding / is_pseudo=false
MSSPNNQQYTRLRVAVQFELQSIGSHHNTASRGKTALSPAVIAQVLGGGDGQQQAAHAFTNIFLTVANRNLDPRSLWVEFRDFQGGIPSPKVCLEHLQRMENNATTGKCVLSISAEFHRPVPTSQEFLQGLHRSLHEQWEAWRCTWMGSVGGRGLWDLCKTHRIAFIDVRLQFCPNPPISSAELFLQMFPLNLVVVLADGDREALERNNADRQVSVPKQIRQTIRPYFVSLSEGPSLGLSIKVL